MPDDEEALEFFMEAARIQVAVHTASVEPREHIADQALANGDRDAWMQALGFPRPDRKQP